MNDVIQTLAYPAKRHALVNIPTVPAASFPSSHIHSKVSHALSRGEPVFDYYVITA
jgi:hypothetical protein